MAVTVYTSLLGLALPTTGDLAGTWGDIVNDEITSLLDSAIAGTTSLSSDSDVTLTTTEGVANQARQAILNCSGARTAIRNITAPAESKAYYIINNTTGGFAVVIRGVGPTTGVSVAAGSKAIVAWDGSDFVKVASGVVNLTSDVTGVLPVANGGTGISSLTANRIPYGNGTSAYQSSANFTYNGTALRVGTVAPLGGATNPLIEMTGNANQYIQAYIYNTSTGGSASSDFAAYTDNGTDSSGWIDMGITGSGYSDALFPITGAAEGYVLMSAPSGYSNTGNLVYATDSTGTTNYHQWYVGGFTTAKSGWKMQLTSTGLQLANALAVSYGGTGAATLTGLVVGNGTSAMTTVTAPSGTVVGTTDTQTLTNKRVTPRVVSVASGATITPTSDTADQYNVTALATNPTFAAPNGTPTDGQKLSLRIKDNGTARTLTWTTTSGGYRVIGTTLPVTTAISKTVYIGCVWNAADTFWDVVAVAQEA